MMRTPFASIRGTYVKTRPWLIMFGLGLVLLVAILDTGQPGKMAPYSPRAVGGDTYELTGISFGGSAWYSGARNGLIITDMLGGPDQWQTLVVDDPRAYITLSLPYNLLPVSGIVPVLVLLALTLAFGLRLFSSNFSWLFLFFSISLSSMNLLGRYPEPFSVAIWLMPLLTGGSALIEIRSRFRPITIAGLAGVSFVLVVIALGVVSPNIQLSRPVIIVPIGAGALALALAFILVVQDAVDRARGRWPGRTQSSEVIDELVPGRAASRLAVADEERGRLAMEIHDEVLPSLVEVTRHLDANFPSAARELRRVSGALRQRMAERRHVILEALGLEAALRDLIEQTQVADHRSGSTISLAASVADVDPETRSVRPPPAVEAAAYRIAQQALANAIKHASGDVIVTIDLALATDGRRVTLAVRDDGSGVQPEALAQAVRRGHMGLAEMYTRAAMVNGHLSIEATGKGTEVSFRWVA